MKCGVIGLGRMGEAVAYRLVSAGYEVAGYDPDKNARVAAEESGIETVETAEQVASRCQFIWLMIPAGELVDEVIASIAPHVVDDAVIIDGGNSNFNDSVRRYHRLKDNDIAFLDCGTSGGVRGRLTGFSLMVGGDREAYDAALPFFKTIAADHGCGYMGPAGAGHYVKMIHNGIEYALMQSYAEGFHLLREGHYANLDLEEVARVWLHGSVIRSFLLELAYDILREDQYFKEISGVVGGGSTGSWTVEEAQAQNIPVDLITRALEIRRESQKTGGDFATKLVALLRNKFGGHPLEQKKDS